MSLTVEGNYAKFVGPGLKVLDRFAASARPGEILTEEDTWNHGGFKGRYMDFPIDHFQPCYRKKMLLLEKLLLTLQWFRI